MAVKTAELEIESPCPITLSRELSDGRYRAWDCTHCDKTVHVLSAMTEREAREFLRDNEGENLCITYMAGEDGEIRFQPEPKIVPVSNLLRRPAAAAAASMAVALAACTPTQPDKPVDAPVAIEVDAPTPSRTTSMADVVAQARDKAKEIESEKDEPCETEETVTNVEVGKKPIDDPKAVPVPGGIGVPHLGTPPPVATPPKVVHKRGARRIKPLPPEPSK